MTGRLRSLRARLLAGVLALAAVCLVVLGTIVYTQQRSFLVDRVDDQTASAARLAERALDEAGIPRPPGGPRGGPGGPGPGGPGPGGADPGGPGPGGPGPGGRGGPPAVSLPPGVFAQRRDDAGTAQGSVVLTYGRDAPSPPDLGGDLPAEGLATVPSADGSLEYRVAVLRQPGGWSTVVAVPLSDVEAQLDRLLLVMVAVMGGVLLLMAALGWWVVGVGLRPLDRMGATAREIAGGDLERRVEPAEERTEVGRLGLALNDMLGRIERAFGEQRASEERLRRFLADASHELRTPLSSIRGYAELFRMGAADDRVQMEKAMSRIEQEAARMGVLVEDLLLLARLDETRERATEPVDVAELARDAADDARAAAPDRPLTLDVADDGTVVLGDADQLRQVLLNLVRNALVHTPPDARIEIAVRRAGDHVELTVADDGPGLPVADGAELFERFWRATPARGRGPAGAGLGLAIVHAIVTAHGGTVTARTRPEGGAVFVVALPAGLP